jgi:antitoxin (DNA-binding transcriptional repressor) of toxin-antitoxin stability system
MPKTSSIGCLLICQQKKIDFAPNPTHTWFMAYTVQQAKAQLDQLMQEAEEGQTVVISRDDKPAVQLVLVEQPAKRQRPLGKYAGQCQYSDDIFKPLETDEELREYGFDILVDAKVLDEPAA